MGISLSVDGEHELQSRASFADGAAQLDLPALAVTFENHKEGLLVHLTLAETDKSCDALIEYDDVKALKSIPGKGLVSFVLKAFR